MSAETAFTKENLDNALRELAKEFRKRNGTKTPGEIILVGGAAVLANYGFREMTYDIDAIINASSAMNEAISVVGDRLGLPTGWLNTDFQKTDSFSPKLAQYSKHYRTFSNVLNVRTVKAEYLVAMKLVSGRRYKKDLSDVAGILNEQKKAGKPLSFEMINQAMEELYGGWKKVSEYTKAVLNVALGTDDLPELFERQLQDEKDSSEIVLAVNQKYPERVTEGNINDIIEQALNMKSGCKEI